MIVIIVVRHRDIVSAVRSIGLAVMVLIFSAEILWRCAVRTGTVIKCTMINPYMRAAVYCDVVVL